MRSAISGLLLLHSTLVLGLDRLGRRRDERGDVPGWVMITVMSATVVAVLVPLARDELGTMLRAAFETVRNA